jgi:hypothetical protein
MIRFVNLESLPFCQELEIRVGDVALNTRGFIISVEKKAFFQSKFDTETMLSGARL